MKQQQLETIRAWIADVQNTATPNKALVLVGPKCSGKTVLAHAIAHSMDKSILPTRYFQEWETIATINMKRQVVLHDVFKGKMSCATRDFLIEIITGIPRRMLFRHSGDHLHLVPDFKNTPVVVTAKDDKFPLDFAGRTVVVHLEKLEVVKTEKKAIAELVKLLSTP